MITDLSLFTNISPNDTVILLTMLCEDFQQLITQNGLNIFI